MSNDVHTAYRVGGWLTTNQTILDNWLAALIHEAEEKKLPLHPVMIEFKELIERDPEVYMFVNQMINQVPNKRKFRKNPVGGPQIQNYYQMLELINLVLTKAPEFNETGLVGFPINAILDWSMGTPGGFSAFLNDKINAMFKKILNTWCEFLNTEKSLYVLNETPNGWMCKAARGKIGIEQYIHDPKAPHWGFKSWNDFFTRKFREGQRPVADPGDDKVIVSACESTPYNISTNVQRHSNFWIKSQPYSLQFMLADDPYIEHFVGGTVYQAFLSAYNYHCWNSPVSGRILKSYVIDGSYYSETLSEGFDPAGPNLSQGYITQVAARALIFIEADDPTIGLMCFMPVGMAEVSSCIVSVKEGQKVKKGDPIGYFQYGGSTHCLIFRPGVISEFTVNAIAQPDSQVVLVNSKIAVAN